MKTFSWGMSTLSQSEKDGYHLLLDYLQLTDLTKIVGDYLTSLFPATFELAANSTAKICGYTNNLDHLLDKMFKCTCFSGLSSRSIEDEKENRRWFKERYQKIFRRRLDSTVPFRIIHSFGWGGGREIILTIIPKIADNFPPHQWPEYCLFP